VNGIVYLIGGKQSWNLNCTGFALSLIGTIHKIHCEWFILSQERTGIRQLSPMLNRSLCRRWPGLLPPRWPTNPTTNQI
jgi:hypothetical protein